jgi:hypothetical protein
MAEFVYYGSTASTGSESRDGIDVTDLWEFVALLGEPLNVVPEGLAWLLSTTL